MRQYIAQICAHFGEGDNTLGRVKRSFTREQPVDDACYGPTICCWGEYRGVLAIKCKSLGCHICGVLDLTVLLPNLRS